MLQEGTEFLFISNYARDAAFHLALEDYFMEKVDKPVIMLWQTEPSVMIGRYQVAVAELDIEYLEHSNMHLVRRSSGGGTIFTDAGTFLYTVIMPYCKESWNPECPMAASVRKKLPPAR